jgi:hypothetical protein
VMRRRWRRPGRAIAVNESGRRTPTWQGDRLRTVRLRSNGPVDEPRRSGTTRPTSTTRARSESTARHLHRWRRQRPEHRATPTAIGR